MIPAAIPKTRRGVFSESCHTYAELLKRIEITDSESRLLGEEGFQRALGLILEKTAIGKKICFIGNGGSAAIASHQATDFFKNGGVRAMAFNDPSLMTCLSNDYSYSEIFSRQIERMASPSDIVFAISSSGRSSNILNGVAQAKKTGCHLVTLSGFDKDNLLRQMGEINFYVPSHSYAHVENAHLLICHTFVDALMEIRKSYSLEREVAP